MINLTLVGFEFHLEECAMEERQTFGVDVAGIHRELPLFEIKPGLRIAILNILGDVEFVQAAAQSTGCQVGSG